MPNKKGVYLWFTMCSITGVDVIDAKRRRSFDRNPARWVPGWSVFKY